MKRLLLPLLAALVLPTAIDAEEFIELKPKPFSYQKSSLVKYEKEGVRFIDFKGTTQYKICINEKYEGLNCHPFRIRHLLTKNYDTTIQRLVWQYELNCTDGKFNKKDDSAPWHPFYVDQTAIGMAEKYCPLDKWSKLPNK